jgi:site-specific recombinase XerD
MASKVVGTWEGGRVKESSRGKQTYYIRKRLGGKVWEVSTGATTLKAALAHLSRFQQNPATYQPSGVHQVQLTIPGLMPDYLAWCKASNQTTPYIANKRRYLTAWGKTFPGDVRNVTRAQVLAALKSWRGQPYSRVSALKAFYSWLRDVEGKITLAEDVAATVPNEPTKPAKWTGAPRAISKDTYEATLRGLGKKSRYRDVLVVLASTGMHTTEARRVAAGSGSVVLASDTSITIEHKSGRVHSIKVDVETAKAANRMQHHGSFSVSNLMSAVKRACRRTGVKPTWAPGCLRHSFISWKVADGVPLEAIAAYTNHDIATLKRFYNSAPIPMPR